ncbi:hypothetical protein C7H09_06440 [Marinobacter fuscus]|uniref:DUF2523 domain-containing protein n=1 Tax=Marinobacter fuscus TaxID=2109942 RepID=A0A2T1KKM8_9GAMM|nr:hypothetical protein [Marinobacter fuscus]PSF10578.1 hypothetical protein C7H09_06440 [Marinobacter fuscus]
MFQAIIDAFIDIVLFVPRWIFKLNVDVIEVLLGWLPVIDIQDPAVLASGIPGDVLYFTTMMELPYGLAAAGSALFARFVLRRIPLIGG